MTKTLLTFKHKRNLYPPSAKNGVFQGEDVLALKRVVSRLGFWPWQEFDDVYNENFAKGRHDAKGVIAGWEGMIGAAKHFKIKPYTGNYGPAMHRAMLNARIPKDLTNGGQRGWDQYSINLYQGFEDKTAAEKIVTDIFRWWDWLVAREPQWHYDMDRPIQPLFNQEDPPNLPSNADCSGTAIYCAWLADALSPDRIYRYGGSGNTGSLILGGDYCSLDNIDAIAKDHYVLAFYGPAKWYTKHVTAVKNSHANYSHGQEGGPMVYDRIRYRHDFLECRAYPVI